MTICALTHKCFWSFHRGIYFFNERVSHLSTHLGVSLCNSTPKLQCDRTHFFVPMQSPGRTFFAKYFPFFENKSSSFGVGTSRKGWEAIVKLTRCPVGSSTTLSITVLIVCQGANELSYFTKHLQPGDWMHESLPPDCPGLSKLMIKLKLEKVQQVKPHEMRFHIFISWSSFREIPLSDLVGSRFVLRLFLALLLHSKQDQKGEKRYFLVLWRTTTFMLFCEAWSRAVISPDIMRTFRSSHSRTWNTFHSRGDETGKTLLWSLALSTMQSENGVYR